MADLLVYFSMFLIWAMLFYHLFLMIGGYYHSLNNKKYHHKLLARVKDLPKVSILIPAHNEELVIEDTLLSMIRLNYPKNKLEVIIINDNSSDKTGSIIESFAKKHPFIKAVHTKPPRILCLGVIFPPIIPY